MSEFRKMEYVTARTRCTSTLGSRSNSDNNLVGQMTVMTRSHSRPNTPSENEPPEVARGRRPSTLPASRNRANLKERSISPRILTRKPTSSDTPKSSTERPKQSMSDFDMLIAEGKKGHTRTVMALRKIRGETAKIKKVLNVKGRETAQSELLCANLTIVAGLMHLFNEKKEWNLRHATSLLPRVIEMLESPVHRKTGLDSLEEISVHMVPIISSILSSAKNPVDVEADARRKSAEFCAKEIRQLVKDRNQVFKKLDNDSLVRLDSIMEFLKNV